MYNFYNYFLKNWMDSQQMWGGDIMTLPKNLDSTRNVLLFGPGCAIRPLGFEQINLQGNL